MQVSLLHDDPYGQLICNYFAASMPKVIQTTAKQLLEILTILLVGDKNTRYGPVPSPENLVTIRKTIKRAIELNAPIPVLVPWGGRKLNKELSLDVAEVSGINQILNVDRCIRRHYAPGLNVNVAIEDLGAEWLYKSPDGIEEYSQGMLNLLRAMKEDTQIQGVRESSLMNWGQYFELSESYAALLTEMIMTQEDTNDTVDLDNLPVFKTLTSMGWKGRIPAEQRDYYFNNYKMNNPGISIEECIVKLADYFGGAKARYDLGGKGIPISPVDTYIQMNFSHMVPGTPEGTFNNTLYYRTVPANQARTHLAPWRGKGYLSIDVDNSVKTKITSVRNEEVMEALHPTQSKFCDGDTEIVVQSDYVIKEFVMPVMIM